MRFLLLHGRLKSVKAAPAFRLRIATLPFLLAPAITATICSPPRRGRGLSANWADVDE